MSRHQKQLYTMETFRLIKIRVKKGPGGSHFEFSKMPPAKILLTLLKLFL